MGAQPVSKAGPATQAEGSTPSPSSNAGWCNGSTPGSEPGGRGSNPRLAARPLIRGAGFIAQPVNLHHGRGNGHVIVVSTEQHASPPSWKWEFESPRSHLTPVTELGIRTGFRNQRPRGHVGSTPTRRTNVADAKDRVTSGIGAKAQGSNPFPGPTGFPATVIHRRCAEKGYFTINQVAAARSRSGPDSRRKRFGGCGGVVGDRAGPFSQSSRR